MKKVFKIIGIVLLVFTALLIAIPFVLESKIDIIVQNYADEHLNAKLSFDDVSLSLISSFPNAEVTIDNLKIVNRAPFENETLITTKSIALELPISALFKGTEDPLTVNEIIANEVLLTLKINNTGAVNYDILKQDSQTSPSTTQTSKGFSFDVNNYQINNSALIFTDEKEQTVFSLTELNHSGNGIFSGNTTQLKTATNSNISLSIDSTTYLNNNTIKLDALIDIDLENNTYTFKDNKGYINALPLEFEGFLQLVEDGQLMDISFKNPKSSFKHFLAIIPETYSKGIEDVETTGDFSCTGRLKGLFSDHTIPSLDISLQSDNASFKYPELPKSVKNIFIDVSIKNKNGNPKETYIDINAFNFKIDEDVFTSEAHLKNLTENIFVNANLKGVLNLANLSKAYPIELEHELSGILKGELNTSFDMDAIATNAFQRIKNNGNISISNVVFSSDEIVKSDSNK